MMDLSLRDLEYVATIARERNITRAAQTLHMAQPALSQSLQRIERRLGVRLFDRTSRQVTATPAGELLADSAMEILADVRRAIERTRQVGGLPEVLRIHVSEPSLVTPRRVLAAARANVPEAAIHQTTLPGDDVAAQLLTGELDLAIAGRVRGEGLRSLRVRDERVGVLVGADHPLAALDEVSPDDLAAHHLLSIDQTMSSWDTWVTDYLAHYELTPRWTKEVVFGLSTGSDVLSDQRTVLLTLESVSRDYLDGLVWRPMTPLRMVPWFLTYREESATTSAAVRTVLRVVERLARDQGWRTTDR
ncbi:LysR family transcriptional regulator [Nocardioides daejeonensis]|uniref:LysR family transcriptional regulator n=1 Tax=Nocardioides daejeonensis TaxID=1046556 RepID=UPI000D746924|nr:LysR family transcriptional regulator [Nocardioides daejeonensis]